MPRSDDDDDDRPRRRRPSDDDGDDDTPRSRRRPAEDGEDAEPVSPRRRRARDDEEDYAARPKKKSKLPLILGALALGFVLCCGGGGFALYYFGNRVVGEATNVVESSNNLKQIGLGLHDHQNRNGAFPRNSYGPDGRALLSWRVHILPYIGEQGLYARFKLNEPWDSPTNRPLLDQMPLVYATPAERKSPATKGNKTYYRGFSNPGALFAPPPGLPKGMKVEGLPPGMNPSANGYGVGQILDGLSNTVFVVEAGDPVEWTKPDDLDAGPGKAFPKLGGIRPTSDVILVLMGDGSFRGVKRSVPEAQWRAAITVAGGEVVTLD